MTQLEVGVMHSLQLCVYFNGDLSEVGRVLRPTEVAGERWVKKAILVRQESDLVDGCNRTA